MLNFSARVFEASVIFCAVVGGSPALLALNPSPAPSLWEHNGSLMYLVADGSFREFHYHDPRPAVQNAGARPGSLLFKGRSFNGRYVGVAYIFNRKCGQFAFEVSGPILDDFERVQLQGNAPRVGADCVIRGYVTSTLDC